MPDAANPTSWTPQALFDLSGQVALVTASTKGLGWAMAQAIAAAGAHVVINSRDPAAVAERAAILRARGQSAEGVAFDATQGADAAEAIAATRPATEGSTSSSATRPRRCASRRWR